MDQFFAEYLDRLDLMHRAVIEALYGLPQEAVDWVPAKGVNSMAVLVAHLTGAERFWIGDVVMGELKERNRGDEFRTRGLTVVELATRVNTVGAYAHDALSRLTVIQLGHLRSSRSEPDKTFTVTWALLHALAHVSTHAGHIQLMRDWWRVQADSR